MDRKQRLGAS
jgi:hypothetical protein